MKYALSIGAVAIVALIAILSMTQPASITLIGSASQTLYSTVMDIITPGWMTTIEHMLVDENGFTPAADAPPPLYNAGSGDEGDDGGDDGGDDPTVKSCNSIPRAFCFPIGEPAPPGATRLEEYQGLPTTCGYACQVSPCPPPGSSGECWQCPTDLPKFNPVDDTCVPQDQRVTPPCELTDGQRCYIGTFDSTTMESIAAVDGGGCTWNVNGIDPHSGSFVWLTLGCAACKEGYHWDPASWSPRYEHPEDYYVGGEDPAMGCVPDGGG